jgi:hypothetical protein
MQVSISKCSSICCDGLKQQDHNFMNARIWIIPMQNKHEMEKKNNQIKKMESKWDEHQAYAQWMKKVQQPTFVYLFSNILQES